MNQPVEFSVPHQLGREEARDRIANGIHKVESMIPGAKMTGRVWHGDRMNFTLAALGQSFEGQIDVADSDIQVRLDLPPMLAGFARGVLGTLKERGKKLLTKD